MGFNTSMKLLQYMRKLLADSREQLTGVPYIPSKAPFVAKVQTQPFTRKRPEEVGMTNKQIFDFIAEMSSTPDLNLHDILLVKDGVVVAEAAYAPYKLEMWHITHSLAKTFVGLAVGLAIDEKRISLDDKVMTFFANKTPLLPSSQLKQLTIRHLLAMQSGIAFNEILSMQSTDWLYDIMRSEYKFYPGTDFQYNSMDTYLLAEILVSVTDMSLLEYLRPRLLKPLGIEQITWEKGPGRAEKGGWGMYITLEDLAKIGQLFIQKGAWEVEDKMQQLIPRDWILEMTKPQSKTNKEHEHYGYHIWVSKQHDYFCMSGLFGQLVYIAPKQNLVVALFASNRNILNNGNAIHIIKKHLISVDQIEMNDDIPYTELSTQLSSRTYQEIQYYTPALVEPVVSESLNGVVGWFKKIFSAERPIAEPILSDKLPPVFVDVPNDTYHMKTNAVGLLPFMIQGLNNNYSKGVAQIGFIQTDKTIHMQWREVTASYEIPLGVYAPAYTTLTINGELYEIASACNVAQDEDGHTVLKITINFLETSSVRKIKVFFRPEQHLELQMDEEPSFKQAMDIFVKTMNVADLLGRFISDLGYLDFTVERLATPKLYGKSIEITRTVDEQATELAPLLETPDI